MGRSILALKEDFSMPSTFTADAVISKFAFMHSLAKSTGQSFKFVSTMSVSTMYEDTEIYIVVNTALSRTEKIATSIKDVRTGNPNNALKNKTHYSIRLATAEADLNAAVDKLLADMEAWVEFVEVEIAYNAVANSMETVLNGILFEESMPYRVKLVIDDTLNACAIEKEDDHYLLYVTVTHEAVMKYQKNPLLSNIPATENVYRDEVINTLKTCGITTLVKVRNKITTDLGINKKAAFTTLLKNAYRSLNYLKPEKAVEDGKAGKKIVKGDWGFIEEDGIFAIGTKKLDGSIEYLIKFEIETGKVLEA